MNKKPLEEIFSEYEELRQAYKNATKSGSLSKASLVSFQEDFIHLKADLRPWHAEISAKAEKRSDKQATAIKFRIAVAISEGEFKDEQGNLIIDKCSITAAEKYAAATKEYKQFLEQRTFYKESLVNIVDIREDIQGYVNLIKDKLKMEN